MDAQLRLLTTERRSSRVPHPGRPVAPGAGAGGDDEDRPEAPAAWRIDDSTRAVGRQGLALAREALRNARRPLPTHTTIHHPTAA